MHEDTFKTGLRTLCAQLPYGKNPKDDELTFLWKLFPDSITDQISDRMWAYAIQQRIMDPEPNNDLPIVQQVMRHLYRLRDGMPAFDWGLRDDLPQRMANPGHFHSLDTASTAQEPLQLAPATPKAAELPEARRRRLLALAAATGVNLSRSLQPEATHGIS